MRIGLKLALPLLLVLAVITWGAAHMVDQTGRRWFEKDVQLRATLAVSGARLGLVRAWQAGNSDQIRRVLNEITRDERILAAAACNPDLVMVARTDDFPDTFSCTALGPRVRPSAGAAPGAWTEWNEVSALATGGVHVSAIPVRADDGQPVGFVTLVHDMSFADRRGSLTLQFTWFVFALLALLVAAVTILMVRLVWRSFIGEARRTLQGDAARPEFQPLLADVRELVARLAQDHEHADGTSWTAARLKQTLKRHLHGEKVVIVANREPYIHHRTDDGGVRVLHPASGLVTALEPVMRACSGVWVAHGNGNADRDTADRDGRLWVPPDEKSYQIRRIWLSDAEEKGYYYGFANEGLWPLCHVAHARPNFRSDDWAHYVRVNQRFADAACAEAASDDPIILVQDYHFALAPRMIRERLPRATILSFWHIPWANSERFAICPWQQELLHGMLGASIIGFHTQFHCNNFLETVERFLEARVDKEQFGVVLDGRATLVRPYPISIEWPNRWLATAPPVDDCRRSVFAELGLRDDALLGVGVDRLDYTKGIEERLSAVERMLERYPNLRGRFTFVQLAAPSRTEIERYQALSVAVEALAARINQRFGGPGYQPIILKCAHHEPPTVFRYYRAADVCYVSSLHDGMNLVAKEFVAARDDESGVLVLSHFTGAARELTEALVVNPYDLEQSSAALARAVTMPKSEQAERMRAMRSMIAHFNVYRWAGRMLIDAAQLRQRERLTGRLSAPLRIVERT
ncbi:MAG TPA: trehalose-6-phosphate synthase, partial [Polyangia bacterium]